MIANPDKKINTLKIKTSELDIGEKYKKEPYKKKKDAREGRAKQQASDGEQTLAKASSR